MLNYRLSQKVKLLGNGEFNHLTINLTNRIVNFFFFFLGGPMVEGFYSNLVISSTNRKAPDSSLPTLFIC